MSLGLLLLIAALILAAALLYSSVGHGGASAYLAVMALFGLAPQVMRPTALVLNLLVAGIATYQFARAGHFSWRLFWPFAVGSVPFAYLGGALSLPGSIYRQILGVVLLFAAFRLSLPARMGADGNLRTMPILLAVAIGAGMGFLAGLTGVGGGIFLSPFLLVGRFAPPKPTSAISAAFIWVNSAAGLLGQTAVAPIPAFSLVWAAAAVAGGALGSWRGSRRLASVTLRRLLAAVLVVAALKLILT